MLSIRILYIRGLVLETTEYSQQKCGAHTKRVPFPRTFHDGAVCPEWPAEALDIPGVPI